MLKFKFSFREDPNKGKDIAFLEAQVYHLMDLLGEQRQATKDNVQRRQARTGAERADDGEEVASGNTYGCKWNFFLVLIAPAVFNYYTNLPVRTVYSVNGILLRYA